MREGVGWILGIAGSVASVVAGWMFSRRSYRLVFQHSYTSLIDRSDEASAAGVRVLLGDTELTKLGRTTLMIWNRGPRSLRYQQDVMQPIVIFFEDHARIIRAKIVRISRADNPTKSAIELVNNHTIELKFTHLDKNDGVLIYILHESRNSCPRIAGTIVGRPVPFEDSGKIVYGRKRPLAETIVYWIVLATPLMIIAAGAKLWLAPPGGEPFNAGPFMIGAGISQAISFMWRAWKAKRSFPKALESTSEE